MDRIRVPGDLQVVVVVALLGAAMPSAFAQTVGVSQPTDAYGRAGDDFVQIFRINANMPAAGTLTSLTVNSLNSDDTDAGAVSVYYTGASSTLATTTPFGTVNNVFSTSSGVRSPLTDAGNWATALGAYLDGDGLAASETTKGEAHSFGSFGLTVPAGAEIVAIEVVGDAWKIGADQAWIDVDLSWDGGTTWTATRRALGAVKVGQGGGFDLTGTETTYTAGPALWSREWLAADFADGKFLVRLTADKKGSPTGITWNVDWLRVSVSYRVPGQGGGTARFEGSQALSMGNNYFHVVYAIAEGATPGNGLDVELPANGLTIDGLTYPSALRTHAVVRHVLPRAGFILYDTLEGGLPGGWTSTEVENQCSGEPHPFASSTTLANSPVTSWFWQNKGCSSGGGTQCNGFAESGLSNGAWTLDTPSTTIPADTTDLGLTFWHRVNMEASFDGGFLQYELNGSGTWNDLAASRIRRNPYNDVLSTTTPTPSHVAWNGNLYGERFAKVTVDLTGLGIEGNNVKVRWRAEQDDCVGAEGWYVDDVAVKGFPACREPLAGTDENDTTAGTRLCTLPYETTRSGQQTGGVDETDWWLWDVTQGGANAVDLTITSDAQFDLFLYQKDGTTLVASDAPGTGGTSGVGATRRIATTLTAGMYYVKVVYVSGTSSYDLATSGPVPLSADVHGFRAEPQDAVVRLSWDVEPTSTAAAFRVLRAGHPDRVVGADPMEVATLPASFVQDDPDVACGESYAYRLEEIAVDGSVTVHGPAVASVPCAGSGGGWQCSSVPAATRGMLLACVALLGTASLWAWRRRRA